MPGAIPGIVVEYAKAKVNLALHVLGRREDGYHLLDSVVAFADVADVLQVEEAARTTLHLSGPFSVGLPYDANNLVIKAYDALGRHLALPPVRMHLEKNLPVAAGIGGGSADAAAALRALMRLVGKTVARDGLSSLALSLGADVPVCLRQNACRMQGVGEHLSDAEKLPAPAIVLVNPGAGCQTAAVFSALGLAKGATHGGALDLAFPATWRNDLTEAACQVQPVIADVLKRLSNIEQLHSVRMSGSGATCFGMAESLNDARGAADILQTQNPGWWVVAAKLD